MNTRKKFVFQQAMSIKSWAKSKNLGVAGWKVGQMWHRDNCSHAKTYSKNIETSLAKQKFSLLNSDRQLKFMLQHPTVWSNRKQSKYPSKKLLLHDFLHKRSTWCLKDCDKTALADHCINKPLKNLRWSYWRLIRRQSSFDMCHQGVVE